MNTKQKKVAKDLLALAYEVKEATPYERRLPASIMTAQAILETGWLEKIPTDNSVRFAHDPKISHNILGIKAIPGKYEGTNGYVSCGTHEYNVESDVYNFVPDATFRAYFNYKECFEDYINVIWNSTINVKILGVTLPIKAKRYKMALQYRTDAKYYLYELWKAGYASDPKYVKSVWQIAIQCKFVKN